MKSSEYSEKKENIKRFNEIVGILTKYDFTDRVRVDTPNLIKKSLLDPPAKT